MTTFTPHPTLATELWHPAKLRAIARATILALVGSALLTLSAKVQIPFYPVSMTMQTLVVLAIGFAYGWKLGALTMLLYLAQGAAGLPVFAGTPEKGIGIAYMLGVTGGYLAGFVLAAAVCGWLAERGWDRRASTTLLAMLVGNLIIYACGLLWLGSLLGWDKPILQWGLYPFLLGDLVKVILAAVALPGAWHLLGKSNLGKKRQSRQP